MQRFRFNLFIATPNGICVPADCRIRQVTGKQTFFQIVQQTVRVFEMPVVIFQVSGIVERNARFHDSRRFREQGVAPPLFLHPESVHV
jgi:hypothetical protein